MPVPNIYDSLGVNTIINAAGTLTEFGGSLMAPEVIAAWQDAAQHFVNLRELQNRVGERIARLLQVESAMVTGGAASGMLLATAAAITLKDPGYLQATATDTPYEVLRQKAHTDLYDRQLRTCGVRIVDVETVEDVDRHVNANTVMMMAYNLYEPEGFIQHSDWLELARQHSIPTLLDAAADTPPIENLWKYNQMGFDMVVFSGGKAICGPQDAGLLLGRKDLIEAALRNAVPNEGTVGRIVKITKEDIVAFCKAIELYLDSGDDAIQSRCRRQISVIEQSLQGVGSLRSERIVPPVANQFPHLLLFWNQQQEGLSYQQMKQRLAEGKPSIVTSRVYGTGDDGFLLSVINLREGEGQIVAERVKQILLVG